MKVITRMTAAIVLAACSPAVYAQQGKPARMVVAFPAGGPIDIVARMLAPKLGEVLGQQVLVDNRGGANGMIGTDHVAKSAPDGLTMLLARTSAVTISPAVYPKMAYDSVRDLATVSLVSTTPELLVVHPSVPVKSVKELVALAKAKPNALSVASTGSGGLPHLALELLKVNSNTQMLHVPYQGAAPAVTSILGGQVHGLFADLPVLLPHVQGGKLRALAVASPKRSGLLPDLLTMGEQGLPGVEAINWYGILTPAKIPRETLTRLHEAIVKTLNDASVRERMIARGAEPVGNTPEQFADYLKKDLERWAKLAKTTNIKVD
jgi:tripartite-type tricarboxylate transporter receptor subunit TctC